MRRSIRHTLLIATLLIGGLAVALLLGQRPRAGRPATFVGGNNCAACHPAEFQQWKGSHHDLAMQPATAQTVLGDFSEASFADAGITTRFSRVGDRFIVHTEGPGGKVDDFQVKYTFGVDPLQQYLIELDGGRMQALTIAWDVRNKKWFSLYPRRNIAPDDWLHWTQRGQNWNSNCAECHSTNLEKNYDPVGDSYRTTWSEINVSCEACHGPGSNHVEWAGASSLSRWWRGYRGGTQGLVTRLKDPRRVWGLDATGHPTLLGNSDRDPSVQVESCAQCHSRRGALTAEHRHGDDLLDHYSPQLLQENIYHPDGQVLDEVYEYGSFVQSKMYHHGVRCSDCHNPHTLQPIATGNALCVRCHVPAKYDTPLHHFHPPASTGASCVECHMPSKTFMVVDPRRDHSLRIPRPDLSVKLGTPNACSICHTDRPVEWAAQAFLKWYGDQPRDDHYGSAFHGAWSGGRDAGEALQKLLKDGERPAYVRASAAAALQGYLSEPAIKAAEESLGDPDPAVRSGSAALLAAGTPAQRVSALTPLLSDPVRGVRQMAARGLVSVPRKLLTREQGERFDAILREQEEALRAHSDNVGGRLALGSLYEETGRPEEALAAYKAAAAMDPLNIDPKMAWAELLIRQGRDGEAEPLLREMRRQSKPPELAQATWDRAQGMVGYQLGLLLSYNPARLGESIALLREAGRLLPTFGRLRYNLGLALTRVGKPEEAAEALAEAHRLDPQDPETLLALVRLHAEQGRWDESKVFARLLTQALPADPTALEVLRDVEARKLNSSLLFNR